MSLLLIGPSPLFEAVKVCFAEACDLASLNAGSKQELVDLLTKEQQLFALFHDQASMSSASLYGNNKTLDFVISEFFRGLQLAPVIAKTNSFSKPDEQLKLVKRIMRILVDETDLELDETALNNFPETSDDPLFVASQVLKETLLKCDLGEDLANYTQRAFYCLQVSEENSPMAFNLMEQVKTVKSEDI